MAEFSARLAAGWSRVLDWVYPGVCHGCGRGLCGGHSLCPGCAAAVPGLRAPFCDVCGEMFDGLIEGGFACSNCRGQRFAFEFARPGGPRSELAMALIHDFKYGRRLDLGLEIGALAARAFDDPRLWMPRAERWPLVPVPLHRRRRHWRQFNQAREIADHLGRRVELPVCDGLKRVRATETQTRLSRRQRRENLRGAFRARGEVFRDSHGVILVDDVFTTGSTVHECAKVLRRAGVQKVIVVTAMRG
jgi:ComF family protein